MFKTLLKKPWLVSPVWVSRRVSQHLRRHFIENASLGAISYHPVGLTVRCCHLELGRQLTRVRSVYVTKRVLRPQWANLQNLPANRFRFSAYCVISVLISSEYLIRTSFWSIGLPPSTSNKEYIIPNLCVGLPGAWIPHRNCITRLEAGYLRPGCCPQTATVPRRLITLIRTKSRMWNVRST